jgi:hypothetical protein
MHIRKEHNPGKHRLVVALVTGFTLVIGGVWAYQLRSMIVEKPVFDIEESWREMVREYDSAAQYGEKVQQYLPESGDNVTDVVQAAAVEAAGAAAESGSLDDLAQALIEKLNAPADAAEVTTE